jgi:hypothetical protein
MVIHGTSFNTPRLRSLVVGALYAAGMVTGTAMLMAALAGTPDMHRTGADGARVTAVEAVMQAATERALVSPTTAVLAGK